MCAALNRVGFKKEILVTVPPLIGSNIVVGRVRSLIISIWSATFLSVVS